MATLLTLLKYANAAVLVASIVEALVLTLTFRYGRSRYDWKAAAVSVVDFLVREYPLRWLLPLAFWGDVANWFWRHRLWTVPMNHWTGWLACYLVQEFCYYWFHRTAHRTRWFWCTHAVHHGPNQLNLSAAYRLGWTGRLTGSTAFFAVAPLFGVPPKAVFMLLSINLLYQFWLHVTWIPRLGPLEWIFNTPSSHRVHHASNVEYLDGNYGGVLVVFDRLFGTYIAEDQRVPCRFGLVEPIATHDLLTIEFGHWRALWRDLRSSRSVREMCGYLIKPPGWRPNGEGETTEDLRFRANVLPHGAARREKYRSVFAAMAARSGPPQPFADLSEDPAHDER